MSITYTRMTVYYVDMFVIHDDISSINNGATVVIHIYGHLIINVL